jgi:hypothetical protein
MLISTAYYRTFLWKSSILCRFYAVSVKDTPRKPAKDAGFGKDRTLFAD